MPFPRQAEQRSREDRREWHRLRDLADPAHSRMFADRYSVAALHARNDGMREDSQAQVVLWMSGKTSGGTYSAVRKAVAEGMPGIWLDPRTFTVRRRLPTMAELGRT